MVVAPTTEKNTRKMYPTSPTSIWMPSGSPMTVEPDRGMGIPVIQKDNQINTIDNRFGRIQS